MRDRYAAKSLLSLAAVACLFVSGTALAGPPVRMPTDEVMKTPEQRAQEAAANETALPGGADVSPRSPGMTLPGGSGQKTDAVERLANPFAPVKKEAPKTPEQVEAQIRNQAFAAALTGLLPLKPAEIRKLLEAFDETRQAVETPVYPTPEPEVVAQTISLDPGAAPPEIKVAIGHVTTVTLLDITGEPWPIGNLTWAGNFDVVGPEAGGNFIRITPQSEFAHGNLAITMTRLKTPLTFILKTHRDKVHYRFDARIPEYGPFASQPVMEGGGPTLSAGDSVQNAILDGVPPLGAVRMNVAGVDSRTSAYKVANATYVRTPLTLLSPGWSSFVSSSDGMSVYTLTNAPVLLLSDQGRVVQAHLTDRDGGKDVTATGAPLSTQTATVQGRPQ